MRGRAACAKTLQPTPRSTVSLRLPRPTFRRFYGISDRQIGEAGTCGVRPNGTPVNRVNQRRTHKGSRAFVISF